MSELAEHIREASTSLDYARGELRLALAHVETQVERLLISRWLDDLSPIVSEVGQVLE